MTVYLLTVGLLWAAVAAVAAVQDPAASLPSGRHGAAYHTVKGVLFGASSASVTGRSAGLAASVEWSPSGDRFRIAASVPVRSFRSGNGRRDRHVAEILGAPEHPAVLFRTEWTDAAAFRSAAARGAARVPGTLEVGGRATGVAFVLRRVHDGGADAVEARLVTTFSALGVEVPSVAGGLVASVRDPLDLLVRSHVDRVPGAERLFARSGA
jgi:polyisoprenoid-binding protein YceI